MDKLTKQDVFNKVWDVFITKKTPASVYEYKGGIGCLYGRSVNGMGCAIGIFIDDISGYSHPAYFADFLDSRQWSVDVMYDYYLEKWDMPFIWSITYNDVMLDKDLKIFFEQFEMDDDMIQFLRKLQLNHDSCARKPEYNSYRFMGEMNVIANTYQLEIPE